MQRTMQDTRFLLAVAGGGLMSLGLFLLMQQLIGGRPSAPGATAQPPDIDWVSVHRQHRVVQNPVVHPKPPQVVKRPPTGTPATPLTHTPRAPVVLNLQAPGNGPAFRNPSHANPGGVGSSALEARFRTRPLYPPQAAYQAIEGSVTACFTVSAAGSVIDPYVAGASSPQARRALGAAALNAVRQWKFFPRVVNGAAVTTPRVCQVVRFRLGGR